MEEDDFVSNCWHKLEADEECGWEDAEEVQHHADFEGVLEVVVTFSW